MGRWVVGRFDDGYGRGYFVRDVPWLVLRWFAGWCERYEDAVRAEKAFHEKRLRVIENRLKRVKEYYKQNLELVGKTKVTTVVGTMAVQASPASLVIVDEGLIPAEYLVVVPEHYEVDRDRVKQCLRDGVEVPGAVLMKGTHLRLR